MEEKIQIEKLEREIKKKQEEFGKYMNEQFRILMDHASRCFLRCHNKYMNMGFGK